MLTSSTQLRNWSFHAQIMKKRPCESHLDSEGDISTCYGNANRQQSFLGLYSARWSHSIQVYHFTLVEKVLVIHHGEFKNIKELSFVPRCRHLIWIATFRRVNSASLLQTIRSTCFAPTYEKRCSALIGWFLTAVIGASPYFITSFKLDNVVL